MIGERQAYNSNGGQKMVGAVEFGLPADGNYRWKQTLDLRQAGVGEASEGFKKRL